VGLHLVHQVPAVVEADHPGIVVEHRDEETHPAADLLRGAPDAGVEEGMDRLPGTARLLVADDGVEDLVLAVLGPGLGQHLQLRVRGFRAQTHPLPLAGAVLEVIPDRAHLLQVQGEQSFRADALEIRVPAIQVHGFDGGLGETGHHGDGQVGRGRLEGGAVLHPDGLDE
jgi:hypothetical protein